MILHTKLRMVQSLYILFNIFGYIRKNDRVKYLGLFHSDEIYDQIFYRIRYLVMLKINVSDVCSHKYMKIKFDLDDDLTLEKTLNMHNVVILIKSAFNKNLNYHYYEVFLETFI